MRTTLDLPHDILRRVPGHSHFGAWAYEVYDTKLARETRAGTILQLCLYSDLLGEIQGTLPERFVIVTPGEPFDEQSYRVEDFAYVAICAATPLST